MRKFFIILGLISLPQIVSAEALSTWVRNVIERAENGIEVSSSVIDSAPNETTMDQIKNVLSQIRDSRSTAFDFMNESQFLGERTLCMQHDRLLLEEALQKTYDALATAVQSGNVKSASLLLRIHEFLFDAQRSFLQGAVDPSFVDDRLHYTYSFDDAAYIDGVLRFRNPDADDEPLCPYTTDYGPHAIGYVPAFSGQLSPEGSAGFDARSYGCDLTMLRQVRDELPDSLSPGSPNGTFTLSLDALRTEAEDQIRFLEESEELATSLATLVSEALANINATIAIITGQSELATTTDDLLSDPPGHETAEGCLRPPSPETGGRGSIEDLPAILASFPRYFEKENLRINEDTGFPTFEPLPEATLPVGVLFRPTYNFFLAMPDALGISRAFSDRKGDVGLFRPLPNSLLNFETGSQLQFLWKGITEGALRFVASSTEREIGFIESISRDSFERNLEAVRPLQSAVQSLANVTQNYLPQQYIPSVAYFMRRSCVDGHCNTTLDTVLKRTFNPFCHPYVSGNYADPRAAQKCFCIEKDNENPNGLDLDGCDLDPCERGGEPDCRFYRQYCLESFCPEDYEELEEKKGEPILCGEPPLSSSSDSSEE